VTPDLTVKRSLEEAREELYLSGQRFHQLVDAVTDYAIIILDPSGYIATWNAGARKTLGYETHEIVGRHFGGFYTPEDRAAGVPDKVLQTVRREGRFEDESWRVRKDGTRFWTNVVITPLRDQKGEVTGFAKVTRDLTAKRSLEEAREALHVSEQRFHRLVDAVTDYAIFLLDPSGHIATWNAGAQNTKGYEAHEIVGRHFGVFYTPEDRAADVPDKVLETVRREGRFEDESWRMRKDGTRFWAHVVITPLRDQKGEVTGFAKVTRDLTAKRSLEEELRKSHEVLESRVHERTAEVTKKNVALRKEIIDRERAEECAREITRSRDELVRRHADRLRQILKASREFSESLNLAYVLGAVQARTASLGGYERVIVWLRRPASSDSSGATWRTPRTAKPRCSRRAPSTWDRASRGAVPSPVG
jgi:PAS domain S-box-containing protein